MEYSIFQSNSPILLDILTNYDNFSSITKPGFKSRNRNALSIISTKVFVSDHPHILNSDKSDLSEDLEIQKTVYSEEAAATQIDLFLYRPSKEFYILKRILKNKIICEDHIESARRELRIHSMLIHPNIVESYDICETSSEFLELLEFVPKANYFVERLEVNNKPFMTRTDGGIQKLKSISYDILQGLKYMHSVGVIHMDIKPGNLLMANKPSEDQHRVVKICDFGLSKLLDSNGKVLIKLRCGTEPYIAPEVVPGNYVTSAVDMWSFGIFMYVLAVGYSPFKLKWKIGTPLAAYPRNWKKYEGTGLFGLIENCLRLNPQDRICAEKALEHQWFSI